MRICQKIGIIFNEKIIMPNVSASRQFFTAPPSHLLSQKKDTKNTVADLSTSDAAHDISNLLSYRVAQIRKNSQNKLFLNGRTTWIQAPYNGSEKLAKHLEVSKKIIDFVHQRIFISRNYPNRSETCYIPDHYLETVLQYVREAEPKDQRLERVVRLKIGNCGEMASLGLSCPEAKSTATEICDILPGDHRFLIVGRDLSTDPKKPESWNKDAVICDPWANAYYPISKMPEFLYNYKGLIKLEEAPEHSNPYAPQVELFNPKTESLYLFTNQKHSSNPLLTAFKALSVFCAMAIALFSVFHMKARLR